LAEQKLDLTTLLKFGNLVSELCSWTYMLIAILHTAVLGVM